jgi:hypothetical protein
MPSNDSEAQTVTNPRRVVRAKEAAELLGVSPWTVRRHLKSKAIKIGPKVTGYWLSDVLDLPESATP